MSLMFTFFIGFRNRSWRQCKKGRSRPMALRPAKICSTRNDCDRPRAGYPIYSEGEGDGEGEDSLSDASGELLLEGEGDASVFSVFFLVEDEEELVPPVVVFFFAVVLELVEVAAVPDFLPAVVLVDFLVVLALLLEAADSFLWAQDAKRPTATETAMKGITSFFIGMMLLAQTVHRPGKPQAYS
jgi:hypothetical protein